MSEKIKYRCWYSGKATTLKELKQVDKKLKSLDEEELESLYDVLPKSNRQRKKPYIHTPKELGYPVVNLCKDILNKGLKKIKII